MNMKCGLGGRLEDPRVLRDATFGGVWATLKAGRYPLLGVVTACLLFTCIQQRRDPVRYPFRAIIQVEPPPEALTNDLGALSPAKSRYLMDAVRAVGTQIELMKSRAVLMRVVQRLKLDLELGPEKRGWLPWPRSGCRGTLSRCEMDDELRGRIFFLSPSGDGAFRLLDDRKRELAQGRVGQPMTASVLGKVIHLDVESLAGPEGTALRLRLKPMDEAVEELRSSMVLYRVSDRLDDSMLLIILRTRTADSGIPILQELIQQSISWDKDQNQTELLERVRLLESVSQAARSQGKVAGSLHPGPLPESTADSQNQASLLLDRIQQLEGRIARLEQQKAELEVRFTSDSEAIQTLDTTRQELTNQLDEARRDYAQATRAVGTTEAGATFEASRQGSVDALKAELLTTPHHGGTLGNRVRVVSPPAPSGFSNRLGTSIAYGKAVSSALIMGFALLAALTRFGSRVAALPTIAIRKRHGRLASRSRGSKGEIASTADRWRDLRDREGGKVWVCVGRSEKDAARSVCHHLAGLAALDGLRVAVVDLHEQDSAQDGEALRRDGIDLAYAAGMLAEDCESTRLDAFLSCLREFETTHDVVLVACPPANGGPTALIVANAASPHLLCMKKALLPFRGRRSRDRAIRSIERAGGSVSAIVVHDMIESDYLGLDASSADGDHPSLVVQ